jgi:hypothetical protein
MKKVHIVPNTKAIVIDETILDDISDRNYDPLLCRSCFSFAFFGNSHDIASLHAWGPYSKRYAGISHIPDMRKGIRFDFSVMPGYYRNRQLVPHVLFESSYNPWEINPEMTRITYRYEMEWKDGFIRMSLSHIG